MWTERKYSLLEIILGIALAGAATYFISRVSKTNIIPSNLSLSDTISDFENNLQDYIQDEIRQAGGNPRGSFQNLRRNINFGGGQGVNQTVDQVSNSNLAIG